MSEIPEPAEPTPALEITPEPTPEPVAVVAAEPVADPPAWDWPNYTAPEPEPAPTPAYQSDSPAFEPVSVGDVRGLMQNQTELRMQMQKQGANAETVQLAEYALLSMPNMGQRGAAQVAASFAVGTMAMQGKNWKQPPAATPPPAQPIGRENPTYTAPETEKDMQDFDRAFAGTGIDHSKLEDN